MPDDEFVEHPISLMLDREGQREALRNRLWRKQPIATRRVVSDRCVPIDPARREKCSR